MVRTAHLDVNAQRAQLRLERVRLGLII